MFQEGNVASDTIILVGAASRGIIQRDHQGSATVYKTYYAPNPFDNVTEEDVEEYKAEIQKKTRKTTTGEEGGCFFVWSHVHLYSSVHVNVHLFSSF